MSVNLSIKGVPELTAQRLRAQAERNHRSLQGELMAIIERAAAEASAGPDAAGAAPAAPSTPVASSRPSSLGGIRRGSKTIEQIAAAHLARWPEPFRSLPLALDIIRADRDSR